MPLPNPDADDHRRDLREATRSFLQRHFPVTAVREHLEAPATLDRAAWEQCAQMGWIALLVAEDHGGLDGDLADLELVGEELGRVLFTGPFLGSAVAAALLRAGGGPPATALCPGLADGSLTAAWAVSEERDPWTLGGVGAVATATDSGVRLDGEKRFVVGGALADVLVVTARTADGLASYVVPRTAIGLTVTDEPGLDLTRSLATVRLEGVVVGPDAAVGDDGAARERALGLAATLTAADAVGAGERLVELTVECAGQRETFGRVIGSYQAVKHKCADMLWWLDGARLASRNAAEALDGDGDAAHLVAVGKACASDYTARIAGESLQLHGGIGFTWEHDLHLYLRRIKADEALFGDAEHHERRIAAAWA
jgi:alkylation response protein AidB-like acyl-CoA dehydrogenase